MMDDGKVELHQTLSKMSGMSRITTVYTTIANMPDDLRTKLSALRMLTPPDGYENIGQRVDDTTFWIYE